MPFAGVFYRVVTGRPFFHWTLGLAFLLLAIVEVLGATYIWKDFDRRRMAG